jgi:hypothetical protein
VPDISFLMSIAYEMPPAPHERHGQNSNECPNWFDRSRGEKLIIVHTDSFAQIKPLLRTIKLANDPIPGFLPYRRSTFSLAKMEIDSLHPCALYVLRSHLELVRDLRQTFLDQYSIDILHLTESTTRIIYDYKGLINCIISPPLVEVSIDDGPEPVPTLADGLHRVMLAKSLGFTTVTVIKIENTACPLIALPVHWDEVRIHNTVPKEAEKRRYRFTSPEQLLQWPKSSFENYNRFQDGFDFPAQLEALHTHRPKP